MGKVYALIGLITIISKLVKDKESGVDREGSCVYCSRTIDGNGAGHSGWCPVSQGREILLDDTLDSLA